MKTIRPARKKRTRKPSPREAVVPSGDSANDAHAGLVRVDLRRSDVVAILVHPDIAELFLASGALDRFTRAIARAVKATPDRKENIEALAGWAAEQVGNLALYFFLNIDLTDIADEWIEKAKRRAVSRAQDRLQLPKLPRPLKLTRHEKALWNEFVKATNRGRRQGRRAIRPVEALAIIHFRGLKLRSYSDVRAARAMLKSERKLSDAYRGIKDASLAMKMRRLSDRATADALTAEQLAMLARLA